MSLLQQFFNNSEVTNVVDASGFSGTVQHNAEVINAVGGIVTCDFRVNSPDIKVINISAPMTLNLPTLTSGKSGSGVIYFKQDTVGGHNVSLNANVKLSGGNFNTSSNGITIGHVTWMDDGFVDLTLVPRAI